MKKFLSLALALALALAGAGCGAAPTSQLASSAPASSAAAGAHQSAGRPTQDRAGNAIQLPAQVGKVVSMAPAITQTLLDLGCGDTILAIDTQSAGLAGLAQGLPAFDMLAPDAEQLAALAPDVVFVSSISIVQGQNPFQPLADLGVAIVAIPTSATIADIYDDIAFIGQVMGKEAEARQINEGLKAEIDQIAALGAAVPQEQRKSVYFEIAAAPYAYSFGGGVYMDEMLALIGAQNALAGQQGWLSVDPEMVVAADPDVILTNVNYIDDPVGEILAREGWGQVKAVQGGQVYQVDNMASSLPNEYITVALWQMGRAVYPDVFGA